MSCMMLWLKENSGAYTKTKYYSWQKWSFLEIICMISILGTYNSYKMSNSLLYY